MRIAPSALPLLAVFSAGSGCGIDDLRDDEVGDAPFCDAARRWPTEYAELEDELLEALDALRVRGGQCGDTKQEQTVSIVMQPQLRCAARVHATFLAEQQALTHQGDDGTSTVERIGLSGYAGFPEHELLAADFLDAEETLQAWLEDPPQCSALFDQSVEHVGIGHSRSASGDATGWVLLTGRERS